MDSSSDSAAETNETGRRRGYPAHWPKATSPAMRRVFRAMRKAGCAYQSGEDFQCPAHDDERASLGIAKGKRTPVVFHCAAGCKPAEVLKALGLSWSALGVEAKTTKWTYTDEDGKALIVVTRRDNPDGSKQFYQSDAHGKGSIKGIRKTLYLLPEVRDVAESGGVVWLVEGEKSADALNAALRAGKRAGARWTGRKPSVATTALAGAAQRWTPEYTAMLEGASGVAVVADNDAAGFLRAQEVYSALAGTLAVTVLASATMGDHDDIVEHLASGASLDELAEISPADLEMIVATKKGKEVSKEADALYAMTDLAAVELLRVLSGDKLRYCPPKKTWYVWTGEFWKPDERNEVYKHIAALAEHEFARSARIADDDERKKAFAWAKMLCSNSKIDSIEELARHTAAFIVHPTDLNADPMLFCCENGTLDLRTGALRPHSPEDLITVCAPVQYVEGATDKAWSSFMRMVLDGDAETNAFLKRAFYVTLLGSAPEKAFFNLYDGNVGNTGKTTFLECIKAVFGDYCATVSSESFLTTTHGSAAGGSRSDLALCDGKRLVLSNEIPPGRRLDADMLKKMTDGGGTFMFMQKYEKAYTAPITFTIWLDGNRTPRATSDDDPLFARWKLIEFAHKIPAEKMDPHWKAKNVDRAQFRAAVLWWIMSAREDYWANGLGSSARVDQAGAEVRAGLDPLGEFWEDHCVFDGAKFEGKSGKSVLWTPWADLHTAKTIWERENANDREVSMTLFRELLRAKGAGPESRRVNGKLVRGWMGVQLKDGSLDSAQ